MLGAAPSDTTVRRALELADPRTLGRIAKARARSRAHVWELIEDRPGGFPWLAIAGKPLTGWLVIDMDATLVTARSDKEGAAPAWKKGYGFHPLGAWCRNTRECLAMLLRPGNAGSNTFTDHEEVLAGALEQVPFRFRRNVIVRVDGAGASHALVRHLLSLNTARNKALFTTGWMITAADEDAIGKLPAGAWKPGIRQDGGTEEDKDVAEITHLLARAENWPDGLRWIVRRVKPSRRQAGNLTAFEKKTGWRYNVICTNIPDAGIAEVPGSHHPQFIDALHREHATSRPPASAPPRRWDCGTFPPKPGRSIQDGSSRPTSPPTSPPGPASSACTTTPNSATQTRTPSATGSGTCPRNSPATPASASCPSARPGPGRTPS